MYCKWILGRKGGGAQILTIKQTTQGLCIRRNNTKQYDTILALLYPPFPLSESSISIVSIPHLHHHLDTIYRARLRTSMRADDDTASASCCVCLPPMNRVFPFSWRNTSSTGAKKQKKKNRKNNDTGAVSDSSSTQQQQSPQAGATTTFVNHGLARWNTAREAWTSDAIPEKRVPLSDTQEDDIYDELLRPEYRNLPAHTKLSDVIRIIPEVWEKVRTSLYDTRM